MSSLAKISANRSNALKSSGPRTIQGKTRSSANALRHGLCATRAVVPGENQAEFEEFRDALWADLRPVGALEEGLVERIVGALWRLRRVVRIEGELLEQAGQPRLLESAVRSLQLGRSIEPEHQLGWSFAAADPRVLDQLARHEVRLERSLRANMHELERLQLRREGAPVQPPVAVDIGVDVGGEADHDDRDTGARQPPFGFVLKDTERQVVLQPAPAPVTLDDLLPHSPG